jgi:predicted molibdopterin-dependent oxidoreductase YjgC
MTDKMVTLTIDGQEVTVPEGTTLLDAAQSLGKDVPAICYHEATTAKGLCRMCVVDVDEGRLLQPACIAECRSDSNVETDNERVNLSRRTILEMLNSSVDLSEAPEIQQMMDTYEADKERFPGAKKRKFDIIDDNPFYIRDYNQCVLCWRCVQVCADDAQYTFALTLGGRGYDTHVATAFNVPMTESPCVYCGQCIGVCPTGALKPKIEHGLEQGWSQEEIQQSTKRKKQRPRKNESD